MQPQPINLPHPLAVLLRGGQPTASTPNLPAPDPVDVLRQLLSMTHDYLQVEPDENDKAEMVKVALILQRLLAKDQQDKDTLMGGSSSVMRALRKSA